MHWKKKYRRHHHGLARRHSWTRGPYLGVKEAKWRTFRALLVTSRHIGGSGRLRSLLSPLFSDNPDW